MRNKIILVLALVFALLAAFMAYYMLNNAKQAALNEHYIQVVTATQDIPANTLINAEMLDSKNFPLSLKTGHEITDAGAAVGRISPVAISKGEYLLDNRLIKPGEGKDRLSYAVPEGMRAMSIPITNVTGISNMIKIGDRVDFVAIVPANSASPEPRSMMVLQNIEILAVGSAYKQTTAPQSSEAGTLTVAVDPQSALKLKMALKNTDFALALRPPSDNNLVDPAPVTLNQF
ncbi:MAG: Flp pilus assembly protein CpaB [Syntrophomonas sp.]